MRQATVASSVSRIASMTTKNPFLDPTATDKVKEQAQQIWLAGLGAFAKAQEDGTKAFEKLVSDGITMQRKVQSTAQEKMAETTQKVSQVAHQFNERATGQWDKLENIFEDRVAKALSRLGIPTSEDMAALQARIAALETKLGHPKKATAAKKTTAKKVPAKKTTAKK
jgi:poly(hydroxyalkanoate) granule-associated protein